ncbi:hypothetical protein RKE25_10105 [Dyella sp. BiH032]|uniref:hypothetical protein n=1 Tax=Dyella sp. BiH032 TaxID=3075430 RepID=UPI00289316A6|nr:hypothetical protein [Dyella sp. BiH032]WNL47951.1 hypothetical protein RKE25_10105 [Dyella sp. BiH032]
MTSVPAIGFEYRPSRGFERALACVTVLAAVAVWLSGMPWWGCLPVSFALGAALALACRRWRGGAPRAAMWAADGHWMLRQAASEDVAASLLSFRTGPACLWLRLQPASRPPVSLLLAPDNSDADLRRRLRMRLAATRTEEPVAAP